MMQLGIRAKLMIALSAMSLIIALVLFITVVMSFKAGFLGYLNDARLIKLNEFKVVLLDQITDQAAWNTLVNNQRNWHGLIISFDPTRKQRRQETREYRGRHRPIQNPIFLFDENKQLIYGRGGQLNTLLFEPIELDGKLPGFLGIKKLQNIGSNAEKLFVKQQTQYFIFLALTACCLAIGMAYVIAGRVTKPVKGLVTAMSKVTSGNYDVSFDVHSKPPPQDEIGTLVQAFNRLTTTLKEHEEVQKHWMADISHELRTPVGIVKGELEAIQDGIRDTSPERINSMHEELLHLEKLVNDLHQLTLAESDTFHYEFAPTSIGMLIQELLSAAEPELQAKAIATRFHQEDAINTTVYLADAVRLRQLLHNLMQNTLRYTYTEGILKVSLLKKDEETIEIIWEDSEPGVPPEALDKLFDRLFRVESSRNRGTGGSGLGLSICKTIVEAHGGRIWAESSKLKGVAIHIVLPMTKETKKHER